MRRTIISLAVLAATLLTACGGNRGEPAPPQDSISWSRMGVDKDVRQLRLEYPRNWPLEVRRHRGETITVSPTDCEVWRLEYHPQYAQTDPETLADTISAERKSRRQLLNSARMRLEVRERDAVKLDYEALDGSAKGVRYALAGGFVIEYEYRPQYETQVAAAFRSMTMSVEIVDNR